MTDAPLPTGGGKLGAAEAAVAQAKAQLFDTVGEIQSRLAPARLLDEAVAGVKSTSADLLESAGGAARRRPAAVTGVIAGILLLLLHRPIWRLLRRVFRRR